MLESFPFVLNLLSFYDFNRQIVQETCRIRYFIYEDYDLRPFHIDLIMINQKN